ncbi:MAG: GNAT family N-acetyltransferase [Vicinamibacterales bacterium]
MDEVLTTRVSRDHTVTNIQIETDRLILRQPRLEDLDPWAEMMADHDSAKFIGGTMPRSVTWRALMTMIGSWQALGFGMFSVIEKSSGRWVGRLGPWMPDGWPGTEVGWAIARDCWGQGYAPEGAAAATDWAFDNLGWTDVIHSIDPKNIASQQVAKKLGSSNRGPGKLPPPFQESIIDLWGQSRDEWRARRDTR